jgi:hypothetical protein
MRVCHLLFVAAQLGLQTVLVHGHSDATSLRVASVTPAPVQPCQHDTAVNFSDDFDQLPDWHSRYFEYSPANESFVWTAGEGLGGGAMRCQFDKGQVTAGGLKVLFGKNPFGRGIRPTETFREIYWRVYVKLESGWEGNPAKLARSTCLAGRDWSQGFIAHVWGGQGDCLCIDPATGIRDSVKVTTAYNDFPKLKWLGLRQGHTPIFSPAESGRWICVESHVRLNTPGSRDGVFELWVDGQLEAARADLDWHGAWEDYAINAVFLENYWNQGSVKRQARWFDNFVIGTEPIGPITALRPVTIVRTASDLTVPWQAEVATDSDGKDIVWKFKPAEANSISLTVEEAHGAFTGSCAGKQALMENRSHWVRVRKTDRAEWSPWHMPFR